MKCNEKYNKKCTNLNQSCKWGLARYCNQSYGSGAVHLWLIGLVVLVIASMVWVGCATVASQDVEDSQATISEAELSRLFENAETLRNEAVKFELNITAPDQFGEADTAYNGAVEVRESNPRTSIENVTLAIALYETLLMEKGYGPLRRQADQAYSRAVQEFGFTTEQLIQLGSELGIAPQEKSTGMKDDGMKDGENMKDDGMKDDGMKDDGMKDDGMKDDGMKDGENMKDDGMKDGENMKDDGMKDGENMKDDNMKDGENMKDDDMDDMKKEQSNDN